MCAFSMCAHMSLRAHRRRAFASWASFQTWNPTMGFDCLASFKVSVASWCRIVHLAATCRELLRARFLHACAMAARPVCARLCPFAHMDAGWAGVVSCGWLACLPVVATLQEEKTVSEQAVSAQEPTEFLVSASVSSVCFNWPFDSSHYA